MPIAVYDHGHAYWNGKIYLLGGIVGGVASNVVYSYDVAANTWSAPLAPLPQAEFNMACGAINNKVYCANGSTGSNQINNLYIYDIAANSWTSWPQLAAGFQLPGWHGYRWQALYDRRRRPIRGSGSRWAPDG